jgi:HlyD family secretion protein
MTPGRLEARLPALGGALVAALLCAGACRQPSRDLLLAGVVERTLVEVVAPISEEIVAIPVARGDHVEAGRELARLDPLLVQAELESARAVVAGARAHKALAEEELGRAGRLHRERVASEQQLDRARLVRDEAEASLRAALARAEAAEKRLADARLLAPVAGTVDQIPFDPGERVPAGAVVIVLLRDGEPWVRVWVPERAVALVGPGTEAEVRVDGIEGALRGRVLDVSREPEYTPHFALTERERVYLVYEARIAIEDAPDGLRPGMPAEVRIDLAALAGGGEPRP